MAKVRQGTDPIGLVEMAYRLDGTLVDWLHRLARESQPMLGNVNMVAYTVVPSPEDGRLHLGDIAVAQDGAAIPGEQVVADVRQTLQNTWPGSFTLLMRLGTVISLADAYAETRPGGFVGPDMAQKGIRDVVLVVAAQPGPAAVVLGAGQRSVVTVTASMTQRWERIAAHVTAGHRLKTKGLVGVEPGPDDAILETTNRVAHAGGSAQSRDVQDRLREAARAMDRAKSSARRNSAEALELWQALVLGRWSLVDQFDSDGRRYLIARKNEPWVVDPRKLTQRERQVVAYAALGKGNKLIGYSLGLSTSTVATHLASAMKKLGLRSRVDLAVLGGHALPSGE
jgi:DNA-binding NarL/FixJ family response regulator